MEIFTNHAWVGWEEWQEQNTDIFLLTHHEINLNGLSLNALCVNKTMKNKLNYMQPNCKQNNIPTMHTVLLRPYTV